MIHSISHFRTDDRAALRLLCFPYAGGGTASYHRWRSLLPPGVDLLPVPLPGHDGRLHEPLATNLPELAAELAERLRQQTLDRNYVLLGHSMGALLAWEIARSLRAVQHRPPDLLILTGCRPPHTIVVKQPIHDLSDAELIAALHNRYGGIPSAVRDSIELQQLLLPVIRADFKMIETYQAADEPPLDIPFLVLGGADDPAVAPHHLMEWRRYTTQACDVRLVPGGHFFLFNNDTAKSNPRATRSDEPVPALKIILVRLEQRLAMLNVD